MLTGWNGLAIGALAAAGTRLGEPAWIELAADVADAVVDAHLRRDGLLRASLDGRPSDAVATLEDFGGLADGLLELALAAARPDLAATARRLVDACLRDGELVAPAGDRMLAALGIGGGADTGEGASPAGRTLIAAAAWRLHLLTGDAAYRDAAAAAVGPLAAAGLERPIGFGAALGLAVAMAEPVRQVVVVGPADGDLSAAARALPASITVVVDDATADAFAAAGFELFEARHGIEGRAAAYVCQDFVCRLPVTDAAELGRLRRAPRGA